MPRVSIGIAHIDLVEHVIECLSIVDLGIQTAREQAAHTKLRFETPCRSTSRAHGWLRMPRDQNPTAFIETSTVTRRLFTFFFGRIRHCLSRPRTILGRDLSQDASKLLYRCLVRTD